MKKATYLFVSMFSLVLMITSCSKTDIPNTDSSVGARLRIIRIMGSDGYPTIFSYNSKGLLIRISSASYIDNIEYDSNNNPIKIKSSAETNHFWETTIEWVNNGFNATTTNPQDVKYIDIYKCELNSKNQIIKVTNSYYNNIAIANYLWRGDSVIVSEPSEPSFSSYHKYIKKNSPFSGINIAIIGLCNDKFTFVFNCEYQNNYCASDEYNISSTDIDHRSIQYTFNAQNYPIHADAKDPDDLSGKRYIYLDYEYESY
jgi:hypothetical protein